MAQDMRYLWRWWFSNRVLLAYTRQRHNPEELELTPWCGDFLDKLVVIQVVKKFPGVLELKILSVFSQQPAYSTLFW